VQRAQAALVLGGRSDGDAQTAFEKAGASLPAATLALAISVEGGRVA
jgi:hypothetical protein